MKQHLIIILFVILLPCQSSAQVVWQDWEAGIDLLYLINKSRFHSLMIKKHFKKPKKNAIASHNRAYRLRINFNLSDESSRANMLSQYYNFRSNSQFEIRGGLQQSNKKGKLNILYGAEVIAAYSSSYSISYQYLQRYTTDDRLTYRTGLSIFGGASYDFTDWLRLSMETNLQGTFIMRDYISDGSREGSPVGSVIHSYNYTTLQFIPVSFIMLSVVF